MYDKHMYMYICGCDVICYFQFYVHTNYIPWIMISNISHTRATLLSFYEQLLGFVSDLRVEASYPIDSMP